MKWRFLLVSCEHGGKHIPARFGPLLRVPARVLDSHRGWDPGALAVARGLARRLRVPLRFSTLTRLLVDLNRSEGHPALFSEYVPDDPRLRLLLVGGYHRPYRQGLTTAIGALLEAEGTALHLAVHSFTPRLAGKLRHADIGLLYDPRRPRGRRLCVEWQTAIRAARPDLRVRRNYPYLGVADGLTTALRRAFDADYLGIEIELNQARLSREPADRWSALLADTLPDPPNRR